MVSREVLYLSGLLILMAAVFVASVPLLWSIARMELLPQRLLDQALKALIHLIYLYIYARIFSILYRRSYEALSRC